MKRLWLKIVNITLVFIVLLNLITPSLTVRAEDSAAEKMTRSMINFFRDDRTNLSVERVARDELLVYGVFLSNFYIPWQTKLGDMVNDEGDDSLPKRVSTQFFGSTGKSGQIVDINKKLHTAITDVLGSSPDSFALYTNDKANSGDKAMTGQQLFDKLTGVDPEPKVYNINHKVVFNTHNPVMRASLQVLAGIEPTSFLSEDGLRGLTGLYMDGLGNVWGSYDNVDLSEYILVLPAVMNPVVFSESADYMQFPVSNVFVMGATLKMPENSSFLSQNAPITTPYYNVKDYFPTSTNGSGVYNANNLVTIFGVHNPSKYFGRSDDIVSDTANGRLTFDYSRVRSFLENTTQDYLNPDDAYIIIAPDLSVTPSAGNIISNNKDLNENERSKLFSYLFSSNILKFDYLADNMYYFNVPSLEPHQLASDSSQGDFTKNESLMREQTLFASRTSSGGITKNFQFYSGSYSSSPFNNFMYNYFKLGDNKDAKLEYLKQQLSLTDKEMAEAEILIEFLDIGGFSKYLDTGLAKNKDLNNALKLLDLTKDNELVFNMVEPASTHKVKVDGAWYKPNTVLSMVFAITPSENYISLMSGAARNSSWWGQLMNNYLIDSQSPFIVNKEGGEFKDLTETNSKGLGAYYHNFMTYRIFSMNKTFTQQLSGKPAGEKIKTPWGDRDTGTAIMDGVNNYPGMYWGYMVELLNVHFDEDKELWTNDPFYHYVLPNMPLNVLGGQFNLSDALGQSGVVASEEKNVEEMQKDIIKKVYGLLSDGPNSYRDKLIKSAQDSWIISTHRAITGSWIGDTLSVSAGGGGSYASVVGYINTPSLTDLPLTEWVLNDYMMVYMFLMLIVFIVLIMMVITNMRTLRESVLILLVMSFILILPQFLVGNVINLSNSVGDKIYSERFNYWAITQHQQSMQGLKNARVRGDEINYIIAQNIQNMENVYSNDVGVRVKWMSPKKDDVFESMFNRNTTSQSLMSNLTVFRWLFNSVMNQEEYVYDDPLATYLYRPYNAIAQEAEDTYRALYGSTVTRGDVAKDIENKVVVGLPEHRFKLLTKPQDSNVEYSQDQKELIEKVGLHSYRDDKAMAESYRYWILNNTALTNAIFRSEYTSDAGFNSTPHLKDPYYKAFSLTTESPFYYFYNVLKSRYSTDEEGTGFKTALLSEETFRVIDSESPELRGYLRDYLDMEGLFTYVIPYLHQGNEYVQGWTDIYGTSIDLYDFNENNLPEDSVLREQYRLEEKKKEDLKRVWKLYTPWVDHIYDLDVLSKKVSVADKKVYVEDTINPGAYDEVGRPMIFSEADMYAKSYRVSDLSDIEMRIQATLESTYKDMLYLANYYDFDNETLITAAAMMATFNFNREFSDQNFLTNSITLYPQGFELKNFNFDAFMRLTLLNATGEPLMEDKDLYTRILDRTSLFTGIALIINDILGVMLIPTFKVITLLMLFFLSIIICISSVISPPEKIVRTILKHVGLPSLLFLVVSIGFAFVISLFMGEGLTGYVGGRAPSIGMTDPTVTLWLMAVVDIVYLYLLWKIIKLLFDSIKTYTSSTFFNTVALAVGVGGAMFGKAMSGAGKLFGKGAGFAYSRRSYNKMLDAIKENNANGMGAGSGDGSGDGGQTSDSDSSSPKSNRANKDKNNTPFRDSSLENELEEKATRFNDSSRENSPSSDTATKRRTLGHRVVDLKYDMRDSIDELRDGLSTLTQSLKDSTNRVRQASRDLSGGTTVNRTVNNIRNVVNNYSEDVREYEINKLMDRMVEREQEGYNRPSDERRLDRDFRRFEELEEKSKAHNIREQLRNNRDTM